MPPTPPNLSTLAARLKWLRDQVRLTQADFAALCRATRSYISRIESGQRQKPSDRFLQTCAGALGVSADWLARGAGPLPTPVVHTTAAATSASTPKPAVPDADLQTLFRILFQTFPVDADHLLRITGNILDSPELTTPVKHAAVIAANLAFRQSTRPKPVAGRPPPP